MLKSEWGMLHIVVHSGGILGLHAERHCLFMLQTERRILGIVAIDTVYAKPKWGILEKPRIGCCYW